MMSPQTGDVWRVKTEYHENHIVVLDAITNYKFFGKAYPVFNAIDLSTGENIHAHFKDMSVWKRLA